MIHEKKKPGMKSRKAHVKTANGERRRVRKQRERTVDQMNEGRAEVVQGAQGFRVSWDVNTCAAPSCKKGLIVSCNQIDSVPWGYIIQGDI